MQFEIISKSKKKKFFEKLVESVLKQLKLENYSHNIVVSTAKDIETSGMAIDMCQFEKEKIFFIGLKSNQTLNNFCITLCHELVHINQMVKGKLISVENGHFWAGKYYNNTTPYLDRPWELQALSLQEILYRRFLEE